jgi:hypothetical protein
MLRRLARNLFSVWFQLHRWFPVKTMKSIRDEIANGERYHTGEICFAVESRFSFWSVLMGLHPHVRAHEVFSSMRVWDTQYNSGVLIYLQLAERYIEIIADRGIAARVPTEIWREICELAVSDLRQQQPDIAVLKCIERVHALLIEHFPADEDNPQEISNEPVIL